MTHALRLLAATCLVAFLAALPSAAVSAPPRTRPLPAPPQPSASRRSARATSSSRSTSKTYVYKYVKKKGSSTFKRVVKRVRRKVKVSCAKQCVVMKKKKKKLRPVYVTKRVKVKIKRGNRILTVKRRKRVYKYGRCPASSGNTLGVPVTISILDGSYANLDFGAFQRQAPVSGDVQGLHPRQDPAAVGHAGDPDRRQPDRSAPTPVFIDDDCDGEVSASIRTGNPTTVGLDPDQDERRDAVRERHRHLDGVHDDPAATRRCATTTTAATSRTSRRATASSTRRSSSRARSATVV